MKHATPPVPSPEPTSLAFAERTVPAHYRREEETGAFGFEQSGLLSYWRLIRRRWRALLACALAGAATGVIAKLAQTEQYQAHASLEIQGLNTDFMNMRQVDPNSLPPAYMASDAYVQTQMKILLGETLSERAVAKMKENGEFLAEPEGLFRKLKKASGLDATDDRAKTTAKKLADSLTVRSAAGQGRVVEIRADAFNGRMAAAFVNTLAAEYIRQDIEARLQSTRDTGEWLTQQTEELRTKLAASEDRLLEYARQNGLVLTSQANDVSEEQLRELQQYQQLVTAAQTELLARNSHLERVSSSSADSLPEVLDDRTVRYANRRLLDLNRQVAEVKAQYGQGDSRIAILEAQIKSVQSDLERQKQNILERIRKDRDEAERRTKLLEGAFAAHSRQVAEQTEKSKRYRILRREVDTNRVLFEGMLQRVKEAGFASAMHAPNVRLVDRARIPASPYKPSLPQYTAIGLFGGLILGLTWLATNERANRTLEGPGDASAYLRIPVLGVIPAGVFEGSGAAAASKPAQPLAEGFRSVLLSILYSGTGLEGHRALVLTSASASGGTTTVATNLAMAFAAIQRKVLLVDGNLQKPRIHEVFGLANDFGLSDLLRQESTVDGAAIREVQKGALFVLTTGSRAAETDIVLSSDRLNALMGRLRGQFDVILVDTPPMLQSPDARVFGRLADSIILVARAGQTTREAMAAVRDRLAEDGICVLGAVLNGWDASGSNGYHA